MHLTTQPTLDAHTSLLVTVPCSLQTGNCLSISVSLVRKLFWMEILGVLKGAQYLSQGSLTMEGRNTESSQWLPWFVRSQWVPSLTFKVLRTRPRLNTPFQKLHVCAHVKVCVCLCVQGWSVQFGLCVSQHSPG